MKIPSVEIRDTAQNRLVTCIEILSPVNKRDPGLTQYRRKRQQRYQSGIHLLEIDFIRRGQRPFAQPQLPPVAYAVALTRAKQPTTDIWALKLLDPLPVVPVPLNSPDPDAILDLSVALQEIYAETFYHLSIDYSQEPPSPLLSEEEQAWLRSQLNLSSSL